METIKVRIYGENRIEIEDKTTSIVFLDDIIFVKADGNYCDFYTMDETFRMIRVQLGQFEAMINQVKYPHQLKRVGKKYIINIDLIKDADPKTGVVIIREREQEPLPVGKAPLKELLKYLKKDRRIEVLSSFAFKQKLNVQLEELNDEHETEMGLEFVDLGLPSKTLWATHNVSAIHLDDTQYFGWGQLHISDTYDQEDYIIPSLDLKDTNELPIEFDEARHNWGGGWRIPTVEEFRELAKECILKWCVTEDGVHGVLATGPIGTRIFLPAWGHYDGVQRVHEKEASYWTATNCPKSPYHAEAAVFVDVDDEKSEAVMMTHSEEWWKGLSIRPVLSKPTEPKLSKIKTEIQFHDFNEVWDINRFLDNKMIHGWRFADLDIPIDPKKAMRYMKSICDKYSPDIVIGTGTAGFLVHQLKGYKRICINPDLHPSESFPVGTHKYFEYNRKDVDFDAYENGDVTFEITEEIHQHFLEMEAHQFDDTDNQCWGLFNDLYDEYAEEFGEHYETDEIPELKRQSFQGMVLYPLIEMILK